MRIAPLLAVAALAACEAAVPPEPFTMTGEWRQSGDLRDVITGDGHIHLGTFTLAQAGDASFAGSGEQDGICNADGLEYAGPLAGASDFQVTDGAIRGDSVEFRTPLCHFTGVFTDDDRWRMTGVATCAFTWQGQDYQFEGQWQADR